MSSQGLQPLRLRLAGEELAVFSRPGLPEWRSIPAPQALLAAEAELPPGGQALLWGCHNGAAALLLSRKLAGGQLSVLDSNALALQAAGATLQAHAAANASLSTAASLLPDGAGRFDAVLLELPKGRGRLRRRLAEGYELLRPGGSLYLAGANDLGIQPAIKDAGERFGAAAAILAYKQGCRIARLVKPAEAALRPGWWDTPGIAPGSWHTLEAPLDGAVLRLDSLPGVFSYDRLDDGTRLLLERLQPRPGEAALDLGCGAGIIGLALARRGAAHVDLVDSDLEAAACARRNLAGLDPARWQVFAGWGFEPLAGRRYTLVASNPPFHSGAQVDYAAAEDFIRQSRAALEPGGRLVIVANRFIRYERIMAQVFGRVEVVAEDRRYHVLEGSG